MTSSIITQDGDIINYANVARIAVFTVSNSGETSEEAAELGTETVYLVEALTTYEPLDDDEDGSFTLGVYEEPEQAEEAVEKIIKWLEKGMESVFRMPK